MTLSMFSPSNDPGPSFHALLNQVVGVHTMASALSGPVGPDRLDVPHGTTVVAARFKDGVIIAGDRRATAGNLIAHRAMDKVFAADRWSAVAIAGAAGPAMEMVKLFQLQLQHYEKLEGHSLSLEGKANQLSGMLRANLPAAMQGMVVVPIFAGYDRRRGFGRLFAYDVTGGRYEEQDYVASGSGSLFARTVIKLRHDNANDRDTSIDLMIQALFNAADDDSATGGPDTMRGIYPMVATVTAQGYAEVSTDEVAQRFNNLLDANTQGGESA